MPCPALQNGREKLIDIFSSKLFQKPKTRKKSESGLPGIPGEVPPARELLTWFYSLARILFFEQLSIISFYLIVYVSDSFVGNQFEMVSYTKLYNLFLTSVEDFYLVLDRMLEFYFFEQVTK